MSELGFSIVFATVAAVMIVASRFAPGFVARWGNPGCVFRGLALIFSAALLLMLRQFGWPNSVALFIAPMWIGALGIVMIGAVTANGALSDFWRCSRDCRRVTFLRSECHRRACGYRFHRLAGWKHCLPIGGIYGVHVGCRCRLGVDNTSTSKPERLMNGTPGAHNEHRAIINKAGARHAQK